MSIDLIIKSIINYTNDNVELENNSTAYNNSIQNMGAGFESYVKELFLDNKEYTPEQKVQQFSSIFSWQGSANNPPDLILTGSYAIEVKKKKSKTGDMALNSSYPKNCINSSDKKLSSECSKTDGGNWNKDLFYYIGEVNNQKVKSIFIIDAKCYSADKGVYERIFNIIKDEINTITDIELSKTKELGKVKNIDPYKITNLRVRAMWNIQTPPSYIGDYINDFPDNYKLCCIMEKGKYDKVDKDLKQKLIGINSVDIIELQIPSPNNLSKLKSVVMIKVI